MLYKVIILLFFSSLLYSCDRKEYDSEAIPLSDTYYTSAIVPPEWIQNEQILKIKLSSAYPMDSVIKDLDWIKNANFNIIELDGVIQGQEVITENDTLFQVENMFFSDTLVGNQNTLKRLLREAENLDVKCLLNWYGYYHSENSTLDSVIKFSTIEDESSFRTILQDERELEKLYSSFDYFVNLGFDGFVCHDIDLFPNIFWKKLKKDLIKNEVLIGVSPKQEWLFRIFDFIYYEKPYASPWIQVSSSFANERTIKFIDFSELSEINDRTIHRLRAERLSQKILGGSASMVEFRVIMRDPILKDTLLKVYQKDLDALIPTQSLFREGTNTTMDIDKGLSVLRKFDQKQELRLIINYEKGVKSYSAITEEVYTDLETDSVVSLYVDLLPGELRLLFDSE